MEVAEAATVQMQPLAVLSEPQSDLQPAQNHAVGVTGLGIGGEGDTWPNGLVEQTAADQTQAPAAEANGQHGLAEAPTAASAEQNDQMEADPTVDPKFEAFDKELQKAEEKPADFNQWMAVEKLVDKLGDINRTRRVYDGLLAEFPLCYGYWKKYADAEHKYSSPEWAVNIFERGTAAVPYSPDLWGYYCTYKQKIGSSADEVRELFERGLAYVGTDYLSHVLWDKYLKFETAQAAFGHITHLYLRILSCPLKEIDRYYNSFKQFVEQQAALNLMSAEDYSSIEASLRQAKDTAGKQSAEAAAQAADATAAEAAAQSPAVTEAAAQVPAATEAAALATDVQKVPGQQMEVDPVHSNGITAATTVAPQADSSAEPALLQSDPAEAAVADTVAAQVDLTVTETEVKAHWLSGVDAIYTETKEELTRRKQFEDAIKRPYFHVKPLDAKQLSAWDSYIDFILKKDDAGAIMRLFERCLVACASYPEFWMRYVCYLEGQDASSAQATVQRAQQVYCKRHPLLQLFAAKFEERTGDIESARTTYQRVLNELAPGLLEAVVQASNFERRQGNLAAAKDLYKKALEAEEAKEGNSDNGALLAMFYAHFLHLDCEDAAAAREVYNKALKRWPGLRYLWEGAIHFEEHCLQPGRAERVLSLYNQALSSPLEGDATTGRSLSAEDREILSERHLDFADRHAKPETTAKLAAAHAERHSKYRKAGSNKRAAAETTDQSPAAKKPATDAALPAQDAATTADAATLAAQTGLEVAAAATAVPAASGAVAAYPAASSYPDASGAYPAQPVASGAAATYYPTASAAAYGYGYYPGYQQYPGYAYPGY